MQAPAAMHRVDWDALRGAAPPVASPRLVQSSRRRAPPSLRPTTAGAATARSAPRCGGNFDSPLANYLDNLPPETSLAGRQDQQKTVSRSKVGEAHRLLSRRVWRCIISVVI